MWYALHTTHRHFAVGAGLACRYPADVAPLAAVEAPGLEALNELRLLLQPGESVWLVGDDFPQAPELAFEGTLECLQMILPEDVLPPVAAGKLERLSNAREMVELADAEFPGFFRIRTCEMGSYYGVRIGSELVAMGGERLMFDGFAEISGVCTRKEFRSRGFASNIIWQLVRDHRRQGLVSWLHVGFENQPAIELYLRMGFKVLRKVMLHRVRRSL